MAKTYTEIKAEIDAIKEASSTNKVTALNLGTQLQDALDYAKDALDKGVSALTRLGVETFVKETITPVVLLSSATAKTSSGNVIVSGSSSVYKVYNLVSATNDKDLEVDYKIEFTKDISAKFILLSYVPNGTTIEVGTAITPLLSNAYVSGTTLEGKVTLPKGNTLIAALSSSSTITEFSYYKSVTITLESKVKKNADDIEDLQEFVEVDSVGNRTYVDEDGEIKELNRSSSLVSIIHKWGFIGGSTSSGEVYYDASSKIDLYDYSIGQRLCSINGVEGYNFSKGGQYAKGWCNGTTDRNWGGAQQTSNLKQAYVIDLGANDVGSKLSEYSGGVGSVETDVDWDEYNNNADTFCGWYVGLVQRLRSVAPNAYIFILTSRAYMYPQSSEYAQTALPKIKEMYTAMKTHFSRIYLIDNHKYGIQYDSPMRTSLMCYSHPSVIGYQLEAYVVNTLIDDVIRNNMGDFKDACYALGTE